MEARGEGVTRFALGDRVGVAWAGAGVVACFAAPLEAPVGVLVGAPLPDSKNFFQTGSTLPGSRLYWSYISSTSHSFAPNSAGTSVELVDGLPEGCGTAWIASSGMSALFVAGNEFRTSRLDPRTSKCRRWGHLSGKVSCTPQERKTEG